MKLILMASSILLLFSCAFEQPITKKNRNSADIEVESLYSIPPAGEYKSDQEVVLNSPFPNSSIRYTLDGTEPTPFSEEYSEPILIEGDGSYVVLRAAIFLEDGSKFAVYHGSFDIQYPVVLKPRFNLNPETMLAISISFSFPRRRMQPSPTRWMAQTPRETPGFTKKRLF